MAFALKILGYFAISLTFFVKDNILITISFSAQLRDPLFGW